MIKKLKKFKKVRGKERNRKKLSLYSRKFKSQLREKEKIRMIKKGSLQKKNSLKNR